MKRTCSPDSPPQAVTARPTQAGGLGKEAAQKMALAWMPENRVGKVDEGGCVLSLETKPAGNPGCAPL